MRNTGDRAGNLGMCPGLEWNQRYSGAWDCNQPTDPGQPGPGSSNTH